MTLHFAIAATLTSSFVVDLPEGRQMTVVNDESHPFVVAHELQVNVFLGSGGEGVVRMFKEVAGAHGELSTGPIYELWVEGQPWSRSVHDLIGLAESPEPRVYLVNAELSYQWFRDNRKMIFAEHSPSGTSLSIEDWRLGQTQARRLDALLVALQKSPRKNLRRGEKEVVVREPDWFESAALQQLKSGHALCTTTDGEALRAVGAIRAMASCLRCHEDRKEGDLLGAFTYFALPQPNGKKRRETHASLTALTAKAASADEFWKALDSEPRKKSWFVRHDPEVQLDLELAEHGIVRPSLTAFVREERRLLEAGFTKSDSQFKKGDGTLVPNIQPKPSR